MSNVKKIILILSGKGGVGKSTISSQLAWALSQDEDTQVGLLDVDICGPSVPRLMGLEKHEVHQNNMGWEPVYIDDNLGVMSIGFMLPSRDDAVIWRGPRKNGLIKQFLTDVVWGELDYLIIDSKTALISSSSWNFRLTYFNSTIFEESSSFWSRRSNYTIGGSSFGCSKRAQFLQENRNPYSRCCRKYEWI